MGGTTLASGAYSIAAGKITFTPSASALLQSSGSKSIAVIAPGYNDATVTQNIGAGAANKLAITTQPTAPSSNGGALATQPVVAIQDQYGNATASTSSVAAAVGAGTWTLGGTATVNASSGTATFSGLTATSAAAVTGATITFTSTGLTGVTSSSFNIPAPTLGTYAFAGSPGSLAATGVAANVSFGNLSATGITQNSNVSDAFSGSASWGTAFSSSRYLQFTVSASAGYTLTASDFIMDVFRSSAGAQNWSVRSSIDNYASDLATGTVTQSQTAISRVTLSSSFAEVSSVTFRIYGWGGNSTGDFRVDNILVRGSTTRILTAPLLGSPTASSITTTTATLGATITDDGGATITSRGTVWGTSASPTGNSLAEGGTSVAAFSHSRSGLTANTAYFYRGYAVNGTGTGYSADGSFTTLPLAPTVGTGSAANNTGFTANWSHPSMGSAAYTYTVEVDDDSNFGSVNATQSTISSANTSQAMTGLVSGTTYFYRVRAVNAQGVSAWSATSAGIATTVPSTPTITAGSAGALSSFAGTASSSTSVAVTGTALSTTIAANAPAGFQVSSDDTNWDVTATLASGGGTLYIRIAASASAGSPSGNVVLSSTGASDVNVAVSGTVYKAAPIAHVTGFSAGTITTNNLPLTWTAASPQPDGYLIRVSSTTVTDPVDGTAVADSTNVSGGTGAVNVAGSATGYSGFTGFAAGTLYSFKIYPYNNSGGNIRYLTASVPTLSSQELLPVAPSAAPTFSAVSASGFTVTWNAVAGADDYRLDISTGSNFATFVSGYDNLTVSATSRVVTGLGGGTTYHVRVRAANLAGSGANSATASQTTLPANDLSSAPTSLTVNGSAANGTTAGATVTAPFTDTKPDVWFSFTAPASGTVTLTSTSSTLQDLDLSAWEDAAPTTVTTGDRVSSGQDGGDDIEVATMSVTSGKTYFIRVFQFSGTAGSFTLSGTMPLAAPVTLAASGVTSSGFTANWNAVAGATGYRVDVYSGGSTSTVFEANFTGFTGTGFAASPTAGQLDSDNWEINGMSDGNTTFGGTHTSGDFARGTSVGGGTTAGVYAFTVGTGNTALGFQPTDADWTPGSVVLRIQNTTGATINNLTVSYKVYVLNNEGRASSFNFSHSSDDTTYSAVGALDYTSQATASASPTWVAVTRSATLTGLSIANDSFYYLRWLSDDISGSGGRDEFALDDVSVTTTTATYLHTNADAGSSTSFAVTGAAATTAYSYVVRAVSATETSANSDVQTVTTKGTSSIAVNGGTTSLTYSGAAQGPTFTVTGSTGAVAYSYEGTGGTTYGPSSTAPTNVGSYTVTATAAGDANFDGVTSSATAFTIAKATPTISAAPTASAITYGQTLASSTLTGGTASVAGSFAFTTAATAPNAGTANQGVTFTPTDTANYNTATTTVSVTVNAASLPTVTFTAPASLTYSGSAKTYTAIATGPSSLTLTYTGRNGTSYNSATAPTNVGDYTVTATTSDGNYTGSQGEDFSITPLGITGSFTAANKEYDGNTSASVTGRSLSGVVGEDEVSLSGGTATFDNAGVANGRTVTLAGASLTGAAASNYSLSSVSTTTANITRKALTIGAPTLTTTKEYDGTTTAAVTAGALSGVVGSETVTVSATAGYDTAGVGTGKTITVSYSLGGAQAGNYTAPASSQVTNGVITGKAVTISGITGVNREYDGSTTATVTGTATLNGVLAGDAANVSLTGTPSFSFADTAVGVGKPITVTGYAISGGAAGNYSLSQPTVSADITAKGLTVTGATATNRAYDGDTNVVVSGGSLSGVVGADVVTLGGTPAGTVASAAVGTSKSVTVTGYSISGAAAGNYTVAQPTDVTVNITPKALTIGAPTIASKVYDGTTTAGAVTVGSLSGFVTGETVTATATAAAYSSADVGTYNGVTVTYTLANGTGGGLASNYSLASGTATGVITAASLAGGDITLTPGAGNSYTASGPAGSTFTIGYAGRTANGITTTYDSTNAPTVPGYYTVTATATGNYSGSKSTNSYVAGPILADDTGANTYDLRKPQDNGQFYIDMDVVLANDKRIDSSGAVQTNGLSISAVTTGLSGGSGTVSFSSPYILYTPTSGAEDAFFYTVIADGVSATAKVTVTPETNADLPSFTLQFVKKGTAVFTNGNTVVSHDFLGVPNKSYALEYSTNISAPTNWVSAGSINTGGTGSFTATLTATNTNVATPWNNSMFFRAKVNP